MVATSREPRGRFSLDGQKRNQLPETDSQLPCLDLRSRRSAAGSFPGTLRPENSLEIAAHLAQAGQRVTPATVERVWLGLPLVRVIGKAYRNWDCSRMAQST